MGTILALIICIALGVIIPLVAISILDKETSTFGVILGSVVGAIGALITAWWIRPPLMLPGGTLSICIFVIGALTLGAYALTRIDEESGSLVVFAAFAAVVLVWNSGVLVSSWDVVRSLDYAQVIGNVDTHTAQESALQGSIDYEHPRLNTPEQVRLKFRSQRSQLGGSSSLVSFDKTWPTSNDLWIGGTVPNSADWFGFRRIKQQGGLHSYFKVSADDPLAQPERVELKEGIKYTSTSFGSFNTGRAVYNSAPNYTQLYHTLHISEVDGTPENVISLGRPTVGFSMPTVQKVAVQNSIDGQIKLYDLESLPAEYQLIVPENIAVQAFNSWGSYRFGWYQHAFGRTNLEHIAGGLGGNEIWLVKGKDGHLKYYGVVQYRNTAGSSDGYVLIDARTMKADIFEQPAADPAVVRSTMQSNAPATSGHPWSVSEPKQFRTRDGMAVWIGTYTSNGAFQAIGIADLQGNVAAYGRNVDTAMSAFRSRIFESPDLLGELASRKEGVFTLTGDQYLADDGGNTKFVFKVEELQEPVVVNWTSVDASLPFAPKGIKVKATYLEFDGKAITSNGAIRVLSVDKM